MATGVRSAGEFCWINILTPRPDQARQFFGALLGWGYAEMPGIGHRVQVGRHDVGGLFDLEGPMTPPGTPPGIGLMIKVDSADTTSQRASELGGWGKSGFDIGPPGRATGRMAELADPNGAAFDIWEPKSMPGTAVDSSAHGAPSWFECMTTDVAHATPFYESLFGWKADTTSMPGFTYTTFMMKEAPVAGMMAITPDMAPMPPHWGVYFTVDDADAATRHAEALGATVHVPIMDVEGVGRMSGITSPEGVMFYVITYAS
ncbi:MAG: VOC family protein [Gemmatimonadota bacterium]